MEAFAAIDAELARIAQIATAGYFVALRNRGTSPLMAFQTYPQAWIDEYTDNAYVLRDPITTWALTVGGTIRWSSPFLPDPFRIFAKAAARGLTYGASIAIGPIGALTICSVARADRELTDDEIAALRAIVTGLHEMVKLPGDLTPTQKEILGVMADRLSVPDAAVRLGLSEAVVRQRTRQVCNALFAQTPEVAVQRAKDYKLL